MFDHEQQRPPERRVHPLVPQAAVGLQQAIGNAAFSRLVGGQSARPVQRTVEVGSEQITLENGVPPSKYVPEFFDFPGRSQENQKKIFKSHDGWRKKRKSRQVKLYNLLIAMIKSTERHCFNSDDHLKKKVEEYYNEQKTKRQQSAAATSAAGPSSDTGGYSTKVTELHKILLDSGRVFSKKKFRRISFEG
ncbi:MULTISPECIES: hypothetical protein [Amycolatopsis]|uniref:Uncharacterized protein n=1 Tax=Amycolatopsis bullii TaxID=941987 RepID=A0ABQ3KK31_9PSEU|nr:hypothetical protein [Amycolatopsis bullii]GHG21156.1 hypothetical protein GCM10017567_44730 [Amycolatopsis bullii]